jgi:hypothetical protein
MSPREWQPLLSGDLAESAWTAVEEIATDLEALAIGVGPPGGTAWRQGPTLAAGPAGPALFFSYLDRVAPDRGYGEPGLELLEQAVEGASAGTLPPGLLDGVAGVAWTIEHLRDQLFEEESEEDSGSILAEALMGVLGQNPWNGPFDLTSGLAGLGLYALERSPRPGGRETLRRTVARLAESALALPEGLAWRHAEPDPAEPEDGPEEGGFNLGIAHGIPGVLGFLSRALRAGLDAEARPLLEGGVGWLLAQKLPPGAVSIFPYSAGPDIEPVESRLGWCYGDAGIATVLLGAARAAGRPDWEREAIELACHAAERSYDSSEVVDAGLCHGAAGLGHLFNRLFQATEEGLFAAAARDWFARALEMRSWEAGAEGIGGFRALVPDEQMDLYWEDDPGFLTGAAGIGLALVAALSPLEPAWDRLLLADFQA